jgi:hypothetical protein
VFGGVLLFHPGWVVSSALAGLASGFGMGPGVSLPLLTAVTLFCCVPPWWWVVCYWWWGAVVDCAVDCGCEFVCKFSAG